VDGEVVAGVHEVESLLQKRISDARAQRVPSTLTVLRRGVECEVQVMVPLLASDGSDRVLLWHGLLLQETPRTVETFSSATAPNGVHISTTFLGSPADQANVFGDFVLSIDGEPTPNLDSIVTLCSSGRSLPATPMSPASTGSSNSTQSSCQRRHLRVESADVDGRRFVSMVEADPLFWPVVEIAQDQHGSWSCAECEA
jgi:hypothetical protein